MVPGPSVSSPSGCSGHWAKATGEFMSVAHTRPLVEATLTSPGEARAADFSALHSDVAARLSSQGLEGKQPSVAVRVRVSTSGDGGSRARRAQNMLVCTHTCSRSEALSHARLSLSYGESPVTNQTVRSLETGQYLRRRHSPAPGSVLGSMEATQT